jgi:3-oxoacyl-(acyl-carrier-protein) synthase
MGAPMTSHLPTRQQDAIAVVGMAARLPGAPDVAGFWDSLLGTGTAIAGVPPARWDCEQIYAPPGGGPNTSYSGVGGFIDHVDCFDQRHFGIAPREAEAMDPMQRLFLQSVWSALEDAGINPRSLSGRRVGVFAGVGNAEYTSLMREARCDNDAYRATGMALTLVANRVSYALNLRGPSQIVDTACSGSLVAVHRAIEQLRLGQCELAVAGGISLMLSPELHVAFSQAGMLSTSGRCRPFDADADGYVRGEGVGVVVLKRLDDALRDGDYIHACVLASAENHGGRAHSLTAPSFRGQADVLACAWQAAGPAVQQLAHIETHGTGTPLGDPIEIAGLGEALRLSRAADAQCAPAGTLHLGALKGRIGHLEAAAGIAGFIKSVLALRHRLIPGNPAFTQANPQLELAGTPLHIVGEPLPWPGDAQCRVAGVSSFGFGGVNAHVVLQSHDAPATPDAGAREAEIVLLSARDEDGLFARAAQLLDYLHPGAHPQVLCALHRLSGGAGENAGMPDLDASWQALGIDAARLASRVAALADALGLDPAGIDLRDCLCWSDVVCAFSAVLPPPDTGTPRLSARASVSRRVAAPSLRSVAASLFLGREVQARRLAIACDSFSDLAAQLAQVLTARTAGARAVLALGAKDPGLALSPPDWHDADALADWLRGCAAFSSMGDALALRYERCAGQLRVPMPTLPFRLDRVWFKARDDVPARPPASEGGGAPPREWPVALLCEPWMARLRTPPARLPTVLPWPAHCGAPFARDGVAFGSVAWGAGAAAQARLVAHCDDTGLAYRAGAAMAGVLRVARVGTAAPLRAVPDAEPHALLDGGLAHWQSDARMRCRGERFDVVIDFSAMAAPTGDDAMLWTHWNVAFAEALQWLFRDCAGDATLLPFRAARVVWAGAPGPVQKIRVRFDALRARAEAWAWSGGRLVLQVDELEVRAAPWLQPASDAPGMTTSLAGAAS